VVVAALVVCLIGGLILAAMAVGVAVTAVRVADETPQRRVAVALLESWKLGDRGRELWKPGIEPSALFTVKGYEYVSSGTWKNVPDNLCWERFLVRSSSSEGIPLEKNWDVCLVNTSDGWKVFSIHDSAQGGITQYELFIAQRQPGAASDPDAFERSKTEDAQREAQRVADARAVAERAKFESDRKRARDEALQAARDAEARGDAQAALASLELAEANGAPSEVMMATRTRLTKRLEDQRTVEDALGEADVLAAQERFDDALASLHRADDAAARIGRRDELKAVIDKTLLAQKDADALAQATGDVEQARRALDQNDFALAENLLDKARLLAPRLPSLLRVAERLERSRKGPAGMSYVEVNSEQGLGIYARRAPVSNLRRRSRVSLPRSSSFTTTFFASSFLPFSRAASRTLRPIS
jgi:hypothetical protein